MDLIMSHTPAGHNHLATCWLIAAGATPADQCRHIYPSPYLDLDLISCSIGENAITVAEGGAGWATRGKTPMRDNKKSRMGLLGTADIDGYRAGEGQTCISAPEWTRCLLKRMVHVYTVSTYICLTSIISQSHSAALLHMKCVHRGGICRGSSASGAVCWRRVTT